MLSFFSRDVLGEILNLIESVSEEFLFPSRCLGILNLIESVSEGFLPALKICNILQTPPTSTPKPTAGVVQLIFLNFVQATKK